MAVHKRITFQPGTLGRFIKKHGIRFDALQVPPIMICRKQDHPGQKHFLLTLGSREGKVMRIPYSQGSGIQGLPELERTLEFLAADSRLYFDHGTLEKYCRAYARDERDCEEDFKILESLVTTTMKFFGQQPFEELMALVSDEGFELEGDSGWRRQRTCG